MAAPVLVWNTFVLASNLWFRLATPTLVGHVPSEVSIWSQEIGIGSALFGCIELALAYLLAGALVLEDSVVGSTQFWPTRPIEPLRLLGAKAIGVLLCFVVLPTVVLLPVWLSVAQTTQVLDAAMLFAAVHGAVALAGIAFASLVRTTAELIFATLGAVLLFFAGMWLHWVPPVWPMLLGLSLLGVLAAVTLVQFGRRRARDSWVLLAIGFVACSSIGSRLSLAAVSWGSTPPPTMLPADQVSVQVPPTFQADSRYRNWPWIVVATPWKSTGFLAPVIARDNEGGVVLGPPSWWANTVASLLMPSEPHPALLRWPLTFIVHAPSRKTDFEGLLEVWKARAVIIGEAPLVVGRRSASDAGVLRIVTVQKLTTGDHEVCFEERTINTRSRSTPAPETPLEPWIDRYFLVNRNERWARPLGVSEPQITSMNFQTVGFRLFTIIRGEDPEHLHLVRLRILADERFQMPISIHGVIDTAPRKSNAEPAANRTSP